MRAGWDRYGAALAPMMACTIEEIDIAGSAERREIREGVKTG
jgi:hypothetical protein